VPLTLVAGSAMPAAGAVDWKLLGASSSSLRASGRQRAQPEDPERLLRGALAAMLILIGGKLASL